MAAIRSSTGSFVCLFVCFLSLLLFQMFIFSLYLFFLYTRTLFQKYFPKKNMKENTKEKSKTFAFREKIGQSGKTHAGVCG